VTVQAAVGAMRGVTAPPRSNGELVFEEPWHARAFGLAVGLVQEQGLDLEEFRSRLIEEIGSWEREHGTGPGHAYSYYERWTAALERLVLETGLVSAAEFEDEIRDVAAADAHDHRHDD
jgi:nitrile hydratase accessory protein